MGVTGGIRGTGAAKGSSGALALSVDLVEDRGGGSLELGGGGLSVGSHAGGVRGDTHVGLLDLLGSLGPERELGASLGGDGTRDHATNMRVTAYAARMAANAKATAAKLKATSTSILNKINAERKRAAAALGRARSADAARYARTMKYLRNSVAKAEVHSNNKFNKVYRKLAANRARADSRLAAATNGLNDSLAKQAALADSRFSKTVKDLH